MHTDPVCGKEVDEKTTLTARYGERTYYFDHESCREAFVSDPMAYVNKSKSAASNEGTSKMLDEGVETNKQGYPS